MRLFTAIGAQDLSFDPTVVLKKLKVGLEKKEITYRWVPRENMHITLNFLGEVDESRMDELEMLLKEATQGFSAFSLNIDHVGAFPEERSGRVIWMGVQNSITLRDLQRRCEDKLLNAQFLQAEKDYRPHLTLARLRSPRQLKDILSPVKNLELGTLEVKELILYQSTLKASFPVYTPLKRFPLS